MQFRILGPLQIVEGGRPIEPGAPKQRALLAFLLIHANQVVPADRILDELWPDGPPAGGAKTLQVHVSKLRKALGRDTAAGPLRTEGSGYFLEVGPEELDAALFERLWRRGRSDLGTNPGRAAVELRRALGLWRGPALAGFTYERFAQAEIRRLEDLRLSAVEDTIEAELALGRHAEVLDRLETLTAEHPLRERLCGQLMVALYREGRQSDALRVFADLRRLLGEELGIEPAPELCDLEERILLHDTGLLPPPRRDISADELPVRLTSFVGRWREQAAVRELLGEHRLVTITGVGGVGKSSLAVEVARDSIADHPDGVWMVRLALLSDPRLTAPGIAAGLGLEGGAGPSQESIAEHLRDRRGLLVLDNCEHLVESVAPLVDGLLRRCGELRVLTTSRNLLGVEGEAVFVLPPLEVPADGARLPDVAASPAVRLLVERARLRRPAFTLDETNTDPVAEICRRVAGIPLALELAAARLQSLSPLEMARRMDDQFELLTAGSTAAEPRQRSLEATMAWSYRLLAPAEQAVLRRLSVFRSGIDLDAAEAVVAGIPVTTGRVADLLSRLVEASLLAAEVRSEATVYRMLEPVRQYGRRLLVETGEAEPTHRRHARYFTEKAAGLLPAFESRTWTELLRMGEAIIDDCRGALAWAEREGDGAAALKLAASLGPYWTISGANQEGWTTLSRLLEVGQPEPTPDRLRALYYGARFAIGVNEPADRWLDELQQWATTLGTDDLLASAAGARGLLAFARGDLTAAVRLLEDAYRSDLRAGRPTRAGVLLSECLIRVGRLDEAEQLLEELDRWEAGQEEYGNSMITVSLGMVAFCRGDLATAERYLEEAVKALGRQQIPAGQMEAMMYLGWAALDLGKDRRARLLAERSLALARQDADVLFEATNLWLLARISLQRGDVAEAREWLTACTDVARRRKEKVILTLALFVWADLAHAEDDPERSARLLGTAQRALDDIAHIMPPSIGRRYDAIREELRRSLGPAEFERLTVAGREMSLEQAVGWVIGISAGG